MPITTAAMQALVIRSEAATPGSRFQGSACERFTWARLHCDFVGLAGMFVAWGVDAPHVDALCPRTLERNCGR